MCPEALTQVPHVSPQSGSPGISLLLESSGVGEDTTEPLGWECPLIRATSLPSVESPPPGRCQVPTPQPASGSEKAEVNDLKSSPAPTF